jgi:acetoacetyl-CoA synthetase
MPLFVDLADGVTLDDDLRARVAAAIKTEASPRHIPDEIIAVPGIPHTRTGKKLEVPVKRLVQGAALDDVVDPDAVDQPDLFDYYDRAARAHHAREKETTHG